MIFTPLPLSGAFVIQPERSCDERGFFARYYCREAFASNGLALEVAQCGIAFNKFKGTVRGMHFQTAPRSEAKLVRCTHGAVYDVIIDLRPDSASYCSWFAAELTAENLKMMYVPQGFAHGYQTLSDDTELAYQISEPYSPQHAAGVRWNDMSFSIRWPMEVSMISPRDSAFPDFSR